MLKSFPGEDPSQAVEAPQPQSCQVYIRTAVAQIQRLPHEALFAALCGFPESLQLLTGLSKRGFRRTGEVDAS